MVRSNTGRSARRPWRVLASARSWHRPVWSGWWLVLTGFGGLTFHAQFVTDDGAVILMHYTGLVEQTEHFESAAGANEPTNWADQYMRLAIRFETGATVRLDEHQPLHRRRPTRRDGKNRVGRLPGPVMVSLNKALSARPLGCPTYFPGQAAESAMSVPVHAQRHTRRSDGSVRAARRRRRNSAFSGSTSAPATAASHSSSCEVGSLA